VGFDVRVTEHIVEFREEDDPICVTYKTRSGQKRVMGGPLTDVLEALRGHGYRVTSASREERERRRKGEKEKK
jgi:precorrin-4 methylase